MSDSNLPDSDQSTHDTRTVQDVLDDVRDLAHSMIDKKKIENAPSFSNVIKYTTPFNTLSNFTGTVAKAYNDIHMINLRRLDEILGEINYHCFLSSLQDNEYDKFIKEYRRFARDSSLSQSEI